MCRFFSSHKIKGYGGKQYVLKRARIKDTNTYVRPLIPLKTQL
jgi:hypothetical protein